MRKSLVLLATIVACSPAVKTEQPIAAPKTSSSSGSFRDGMKESVQPGEDFFAYANGGWIEKTQIPKDRSSWGVFEEVAEKTDAQNAELIKKASSNASPEGKKVAAYYGAFMDEAAIEAKGLTPLDLRSIFSTSTRRASSSAARLRSR